MGGGAEVGVGGVGGGGFDYAPASRSWSLAAAPSKAPSCYCMPPHLRVGLKIGSTKCHEGAQGAAGEPGQPSDAGP